MTRMSGGLHCYGAHPGERVWTWHYTLEALFPSAYDRFMTTLSYYR